VDSFNHGLVRRPGWRLSPVDLFELARGAQRPARQQPLAADAARAFTVVWHHGSPRTGALLEPLQSAAARRGIRLLSYGRPSYGGSSPRPGREVASAAADVAQLADVFGVARFAVMGASGGGPHALACVLQCWPIG
jgi:pimeloyl-ACP methyl ester carboxylesterase